MEDETHDCPDDAEHLCSNRKLAAASKEAMERLVRGIDRKWITYLIRNSPHLQQSAFRGFRPDHLPWASVPSRLARDAGEDPNLRGVLLWLWNASNSELCESVRGEVNVESFEDDVTILLAKVGPDERESLWWALYLDDRADIHKKFVDGPVSVHLLDEDSPLAREAACLAPELNLRGADSDVEEEMGGNMVVENELTVSDEDQKLRVEEYDTVVSGEESTVPHSGAVIQASDQVHRECRERLAEALRLLDEVRLENAGLRMRLQRLEES